MSTGQHQVYADLVGGLVDAREDPAGQRFDAELAEAVARGEVSADTASRLTAWQRASVRGVADHVRSVLPLVLTALGTARTEAAEQVVEVATALASGTSEQGSAAANGATVPAPRDTPEPTSSHIPPGPNTMEPPPSRLMVAELVPSRSPVVNDPR